MQRQTVSSPSGSGCQHTRIHGSTHTLPEILWNPGHIALNDITGPYAICRQNVTQSIGLLAADQSNMSTASRVMFDPFHHMWPGSNSGKVDSPDTALVATTTVPNGYSTGVIATTFTMTALWESQLLHRPAFPQMIIHRSPQMSGTGCNGFI